MKACGLLISDTVKVLTGVMKAESSDASTQATGLKIACMDVALSSTKMEIVMTVTG